MQGGSDVKSCSCAGVEGLVGCWMGETLCDWSKSEIKERRGELYMLTAEPKFFCRKCARVAGNHKVLCKPMKFGGKVVKDAGRGR